MLFVGEGRCPEATHGQQQCRPEPGSRTPRHLYTRPSEGPELSLQGTEGVLVGSATGETAHPEDLAQQAPCCPGSWEPRLRGQGFRCLARPVFLLPVSSRGRERHAAVFFPPYRGTNAISGAHAQDFMSPNPSQRPLPQVPPHCGSGRACERWGCCPVSSRGEVRLLARRRQAC